MGVLRNRTLGTELIRESCSREEELINSCMPRGSWSFSVSRGLGMGAVSPAILAAPSGNEAEVQFPRASLQEAQGLISACD